MAFSNRDSHHRRSTRGEHSPAESDGIRPAGFVLCDGNDDLFGIPGFDSICVIGLFLHCILLDFAIYFYYRSKVTISKSFIFYKGQL